MTTFHIVVLAVCWYLSGALPMAVLAFFDPVFRLDDLVKIIVLSVFGPIVIIAGFAIQLVESVVPPRRLFRK